MSKLVELEKVNKKIELSRKMQELIEKKAEFDSMLNEIGNEWNEGKIIVDQIKNGKVDTIKSDIAKLQEDLEKEKDRVSGTMRTKSAMYKKERMQTVKELEEILGLTDTNRSFIALDITEEKKAKIIALEENVKKYFRYAGWSYFIADVDKKHLSLLKAIFKDTGYKTDRNSVFVTINGKKIHTQRYTVTKVN